MHYFFGYNVHTNAVEQRYSLGNTDSEIVFASPLNAFYDFLNFTNLSIPNVLAVKKKEKF